MARNHPALTGFLDAVVFRYSSYDTPLWARNNTTDGRWHRAGDGATQYLTLHPDGAWAELARAEALKTDEELSLVQMPIWALRLSQQAIVDYSTFDHSEAAGFAPDALIDDEYVRCQEEGLRLRRLGYCGVAAPSAALPGVTNITIFGRRMASTWGSSTRLASSVPTCVVAVGAPASGLADRVRHFGLPHSGFAAYVEGLAAETRLEQLQLDEPGTQRDRFGLIDESEEKT